jgi:hypothetical protein
MRRTTGTWEKILSQRSRRTVGMDTDSQFMVNPFLSAIG